MAVAELLAVGKMCLGEETLHPQTHRLETEIEGTYLIQRYPQAFRRIVVGRQGSGVGYLAGEEKVLGGYVDTGIVVEVGQAEQIADAFGLEPSLLLQFAAYALLGGLADVGKTTGQVECAFGRRVFAAYGQQGTVFHNYGYTGAARIHEHLKAAISTLAALEACSVERGTSAERAV